MFIGQASHQLDEKGRIRLPAKFKDELGKNPFITCGTNNCLFVYSRAEAERVLFDKFHDNDFADAEKSRAMRLIMANAIFAEEDKQGRILLPQNLLAHANIVKNIVTIGAYNRVEIWSEESWKEYNRDNNFDACLETIKKA